jgi:hypothetical protein
MNDSKKPELTNMSRDQSSFDRHKASQAAKAAAKQARLKAALRDNLRRRKASDVIGNKDEVDASS